MPAGEAAAAGDEECWALAVERDGAFLRDGCYTASAAARAPGGAPATYLCALDFVTASRCMLVEGAELWVRVSAALYQSVLAQALEQGFALMLPVSQQLHEDMPAQHSRYLRAFYVLGGSLHDCPAAHNYVRVIVVVASKRSVPGKKAAADDRAGAASRVNQNISAENTRFVAISLPLVEDGGPVLDRRRQDGVPFYKYLKEDTSSRGR